MDRSEAYVSKSYILYIWTGTIIMKAMKELLMIYFHTPLPLRLLTSSSAGMMMMEWEGGSHFVHEFHCIVLVCMLLVVLCKTCLLLVLDIEKKIELANLIRMH